MSVSFTRSREQLATLVLSKLTAGNTPTAAELTIVYEAIDLRLKEMHRMGIFWRKVVEVPVTFSLSAGINSASAGAGDILFPIKVTFSNGANDEPVLLIGKTEYAAIPDKTITGDPCHALWMGGSQFIFHPVPGADGTGKLLYEKIADDTAVSTAPDVDVAMLRWLKDIVAYDVGDQFGVGEIRMVRLERESLVAERNIRKLGVQHVDLVTVAVDDFDNSEYRRESDYGR